MTINYIFNQKMLGLKKKKQKNLSLRCRCNLNMNRPVCYGETPGALPPAFWPTVHTHCGLALQAMICSVHGHRVKWQAGLCGHRAVPGRGTADQTLRRCGHKAACPTSQQQPLLMSGRAPDWPFSQVVWAGQPSSRLALGTQGLSRAWHMSGSS